MPIDYDDDDAVRGEGSPVVRVAYALAVVFVKVTVSTAILFGCAWFWFAIGRMFLGFLQGVTQ